MSEQDIPTELPEPLPDARSEGALRIAFLTTEYATEPTFYDGGVAQLLGRQSRALLERCHRVEVFVIGDDEVTYEADGVIVHRVRATSRAADFLHTQANRVFRHGWHESVHCLSVAASLRGALLRRHREAPFDLAQVTSLRAAPLLLGRGLSALPVVVQLSSDFEAVRKAYRQKPTADGRLARWLTLQACRRARNIYVPSDLVARAMAERHGMRVRVLRPTVELKKVPCDWSIYEEHGKGRDYLLFHGSIGRLKGVAVLVAALERLMDRLPDLRMLFIGKDAPMGDGEGTGVEFIRERLGRFGDRVLRLDRMPHSQLYPFLSRARGSVLPSLVDNLPNAAIEAMLFGRVLIGTRGASFEELIEDEKSGLLVEIGDVPGLAMAMERLWGMSALERDAIGALARESAQRFSAERTIPALESYFREVVAGEIRN